LQLNLVRQRPSRNLEPFKRLSSETIKARPTNPSAAASMCQNGEILSQCNRINPKKYLKYVGANRRGDEPEMKL